MYLQKIKNWLLEHQHTLAIALAVVGGIFYLFQSWKYAHTLPSSIWHESMYLYKGYMFASGQYRPFEDDGLWINFLLVFYFFLDFFHGFALSYKDFSFSKFLNHITHWIIVPRVPVTIMVQPTQI